MSQPSPYPEFTRQETIAIGGIILTASLSALSAFTLLCYVISVRIRTRGQAPTIILNNDAASLAASTAIGGVSVNQSAKEVAETWLRLKHRLRVWICSLLFADVIQSTGTIIGSKWLAEGRVTEGTLCSLQGGMKQYGNVTVALFSLIIAVDTFAILVLEVAPSNQFGPTAVSIVTYLVVALIVGIPAASNRSEGYFGNTGWWCWISSKYEAERIALEYAWFWVAALAGLFFYPLVFFALRGNITISKGLKISIRQRNSLDRIEEAGNPALKELLRFANKMVLYPLAYVVIVAPISISRFIAFSGRTVPIPWRAISAVLFNLGGLFNSLLFTATWILTIRFRETPDALFPHTADTLLGSLDDENKHGLPHVGHTPTLGQHFPAFSGTSRDSTGGNVTYRSSAHMPDTSVTSDMAPAVHQYMLNAQEQPPLPQPRVGQTYQLNQGNPGTPPLNYPQPQYQSGPGAMYPNRGY